MTDAPERIYLQVCHDEQCNEPFGAQAHDDISWCQDKINEGDVAYVRADKFDALAERADALHAALRRTAILHWQHLDGSEGYRCLVCKGEWARDRPDGEWHESGCLVAPSAPKEG